jgi:hypothetical protein
MRKELATDGRKTKLAKQTNLIRVLVASEFPEKFQFRYRSIPYCLPAH